MMSQHDGVAVTHATGVMSTIMGNSQFAITSNGRTVYELAHLNVPAIVVPQHEREGTHSFATEANGFIPLDTYSRGDTEKEIMPILKRVITDRHYRFQLYSRMLRFSFIESRETVLSAIRKLTEYN
jgi:spore coat polysaccharide biosynthesis predicted glycosyltransferase SpsG